MFEQKKRIIKIKVKDETRWSCQYNDEKERDDWYAKMQARVVTSKENGKRVNKPFLPEHTTEDVENPDYEPEYAVKRQQVYMANAAKQLDLIVEAVLNDNAEAKEQLKALIQGVKDQFPKPE